MPDDSPILSLPYIQPAQAQKHVTHNEAIRILDVAVQLAVMDLGTSSPPATPASGDRHVVGAAASGAWAGHEDDIALFADGYWQFYAPRAGWRAFVTAADAVAVFDGAGWVLPQNRPMQVQQLGVSATPDLINRLVVSAEATLLNNAGAGHQLKLNKAAATDTASLLFQTGYSGRAEMGTAGNDDFAVKVSANGSTFNTALQVDAASGIVALPQGLRLSGQAADPALLQDGMIWRNTTSGEVKLRSNGTTQVLGLPTALLPPVGEYVMTTAAGGGVTATTIVGAAGRMDLFAWVAGCSVTSDFFALNCTTAVAAAQAKFIVYASDTEGRPDQLLLESGTVDLNTTGNKSAALALSFDVGRLYWVGVRHSSTAGINGWAGTAVPDINGGTTLAAAARKTLRRTLAFATPAPTNWGFVSSEANAASPPAVWVRRGV